VRVKFGFLRTRVGRRLFTRFLLAALLPATLVAVLAFAAVKDVLNRQLVTHVRASAKHAALNALASLQRVEEVFRELAIQEHVGTPGDSIARPVALASLEAVGLGTIEAGVPTSLGKDSGHRSLTDHERKHLSSGRTLLTTVKSGLVAQVLMVRLDPRVADGIVWGWVAPSAIWGTIAEALEGSSSRLCALEVDGSRPLSCEVPLSERVVRDLLDVSRVGGEALAGWSDGATQMYSASSIVFLRYEYGAGDWHIIVSENGEAVFASLRKFTLTFLGVVILALLVVFFLSHTQIRRSTAPLERLHEGTQRLAAGDFRTMVRVDAGDEFSDLATSFNGMAQSLNKQLISLRSLDGLHRAVMGARDTHPLLETAIERLGDIVPGSDLLIGVEQGTGVMHGVVRSRFDKAVRQVTIDVTAPDREKLRDAPSGIAQPGAVAGSYLAQGAFGLGASTTHLFPLRNDRQLLGFIAVATPDSCLPAEDDVEGLRRHADRLALAVIDVQHIQHLDALSSGTLTAFARAIDANSPWTAGHSERVTEITVEIGGRLGLKTEELRILRRGGLLHDIGKIGVPPSILDKAGPLTDSERSIIERHPGLGAEILEPIGAFTDAIPIVRSHHERMNGSGYPDGLAGENIPYHARILAVADVFDALVSDRPYRSGLTISLAQSIIEKETGSHFDPDPAQALVRAVRDGSVQAIFERQHCVADLSSAVAAGRRAVEELV
jgi:putative nucleotidyltransferase with HDIG domain